MTARAALYKLINDEVADGQSLHDLGFTAVESTNSIDTPDANQFIIIRWGQDGVPAFKGKAANNVTIWLHSKDQDYDPIDKGIERIKELLAEAVHLAGSDNWILTVAEWTGDSADLIDDGFNTITRNCGFTVVSRYNAT